MLDFRIARGVAMVGACLAGAGLLVPATASAAVRYTADITYDPFSGGTLSFVLERPDFITGLVDAVMPNSCTASVMEVCDGLAVTFLPSINVGNGVGPDQNFAYLAYESPATFGALVFPLGTLSQVGTFTGDSPGIGAQGTLTIENLANSVPEPATWGMLLLGFGLVGAALRRNGRRAAIA